MRPIPPKLKTEMSEDVFYSKCCASALSHCSGGVQWHHVWIYAGSQINEPWSIVPACERHHDQVNKEPAVKRYFERISLSRASKEDLSKYPRKNWEQIKKSLQ